MLALFLLELEFHGLDLAYVFFSFLVYGKCLLLKLGGRSSSQ